MPDQSPSVVELVALRTFRRSWRATLFDADFYPAATAHSLTLSPRAPPGAVDPLDLPKPADRARISPRPRHVDCDCAYRTANISLSARVDPANDTGTVKATLRPKPPVLERLRTELLRKSVRTPPRAPHASRAPRARPRLTTRSKTPTLTLSCSSSPISTASYSVNASMGSRSLVLSRDSSNLRARAHAHTTLCKTKVSASLNLSTPALDAKGTRAIDAEIAGKSKDGKTGVTLGACTRKGPRADASLRGMRFKIDRSGISALMRGIELAHRSGVPSFKASLYGGSARLQRDKLRLDYSRGVWRMESTVGKKYSMKLGYSDDGRSLNLDVSKSALELSARFDPKGTRRRRALVRLHVPRADGAWNVALRLGWFL